VDNSFFRYLTSDGLAATLVNANANLDFTIPPDPTSFFIAAGAEGLEVARLIVQVQDVGALDAGFYGNNIVLANGIIVQHQDAAGLPIRTLTELPVMTNADWARYSFDSTPSTYGAGNNYVSCRWTFTKTGSGLILAAGERIAAVFDDDLTGLVGHFFQVQGRGVVA